MAESTPLHLPPFRVTIRAGTGPHAEPSISAEPPADVSTAAGSDDLVDIAPRYVGALRTKRLVGGANSGDDRAWPFGRVVVGTAIGGGLATTQHAATGGFTAGDVLVGIVGATFVGSTAGTHCQVPLRSVVKILRPNPNGSDTILASCAAGLEDVVSAVLVGSAVLKLPFAGNDPNVALARPGGAAGAPRICVVAPAKTERLRVVCLALRECFGAAVVQLVPTSRGASSSGSQNESHYGPSGAAAPVGAASGGAFVATGRAAAAAGPFTAVLLLPSEDDDADGYDDFFTQPQHVPGGGTIAAAAAATSGSQSVEQEDALLELLRNDGLLPGAIVVVMPTVGGDVAVSLEPAIETACVAAGSSIHRFNLIAWLTSPWSAGTTRAAIAASCAALLEGLVKPHTCHVAHAHVTAAAAQAPEAVARTLVRAAREAWHLPAGLLSTGYALLAID
jgi:hypothetical protein